MSASSSTLPSRRLKYRPDIDGLRAVAVLSVVFFHMNWKHVTGGFVGVDVFFVISGYLISYIVFSEVAESRFSVVSFYERRIRRIFPALFGVLTAYTIFALIYLLPGELKSYGQSLMAATLSASNFYFWKHSGYFDSPTSFPLLHTWSLGVEEQFYIIFPIFLIIARKFFPKRLRATVVVLFVVSLALSIWEVHQSAQTTFYMLSTRAWELLMGTGLSLGLFPRLNNTIARNVVSLLGLGLILYSVVFYTKETLFPGLSAVPPVLGSALIIGAGEAGSSLVGSVLAWRPVVFIGLISYSLYLWHWPVIIVQKLAVFGPMEHGTVIIVSFVLAILSWQFVEKPFRTGPLKLSGRPLFVAASIVLAIFVAASGILIFSDGLHGRFTAHAEQIGSFIGRTDLQHALTRSGSCFLEPDYTFKDYKQNVCLQRDPAKTKNYLLVGDSHAAVLHEALAQALPDANILQATATPCIAYVHATGSERCQDLMKFVYEDYLPQHPVQALLIEQRWRDENLPGMESMLTWAKQQRLPVVLLGDVPEYDESMPRLLAYSIAKNQPQLMVRHRSKYSGPLDTKMEKLAAEKWHVPYLSLYQALCKQGDCQLYADQAQQIPLLADDDHFTREGALRVIGSLAASGQLQQAIEAATSAAKQDAR